MKHCRGFTLIEMMVVVALVGILAFYSVSGFQNLIIRNRISAHTSALLADLNYARNEAVTRGSDVSMTSSGESLMYGWKLTDSASVVLRVRAEPLARAILAAESSGSSLSGQLKITFDRQGLATVTAGSTEVGNKDVTLIVRAEDCPPGLRGGQRQIVIKPVGRVGVTSADTDRNCP
jgi:type IV fimbrial biogenesis protein FimT